jgi:L-fuconolactonase
MRIDSQQYFWSAQPSYINWQKNRPAILRQPYLPEHIAPQLIDNGFNGCLSTQVSSNKDEIDFLLDQQSANPFVKGIIGMTQPGLAALDAHLERYGPHFVSVQHSLRNTPENLNLLDFVTDDFAKLATTGLPIELAVKSSQLPQFIDLIDHFQNLVFILQSLADPLIQGQSTDHKAFNEWSGYLKKIGQRDNVWCKLAGLVTRADFREWTDFELPTQVFLPSVDVALDAFGSHRLLFASEWPVHTMAATFDEVCDLAAACISTLSESEQEAVMGQNAMQCYGIELS